MSDAEQPTTPTSRRPLRHRAVEPQAENHSKGIPYMFADEPILNAKVPLWLVLVGGVVFAAVAMYAKFPSATELAGGDEWPVVKSLRVGAANMTLLLFHLAHFTGVALPALALPVMLLVAMFLGIVWLYRGVRWVLK